MVATRPTSSSLLIASWYVRPSTSGTSILIPSETITVTISSGVITSPASGMVPETRPSSISSENSSIVSNSNPKVFNI